MTWFCFTLIFIFSQVIKARFGSRTHLVFCTFAFLTNLIVLMSLTIAGTAVLNSLVADLSPELAAMLLASVIGGYTLIGGLGATFYVSYFNTALIFVLILMLVVEVFYNPFGNPENPFGSSESVFEFIACWKAPQEKMGNKGGSYLTFFSSGKSILFCVWKRTEVYNSQLFCVVIKLEHFGKKKDKY